MTAIAINYDAPPTLSRFMDSSAFVRCVVGPVGSGKSSACVMEIPRRAIEQKPGPDGKRRTRWLVIRNTYPELRDTTRKTFEQWVPAELGKWNEQQFTFRMKFNDVEAEVLFRALDRPEDVKKLLSLELTGAYINEAREVPKSVFDLVQSRVGRYPSKAQGGPTWFGVWLDTNPWHIGHWGYKHFSEESHAEHELFEQPGGRTPEAENVENLPPRYYERLVAGKDSEWVESYIDSKYPLSGQGSYYGKQMAALKKAGRVVPFDVDPHGIFTAWDLGHDDSTSIFWWRVNEFGSVDILDHYESNNHSMAHYFRVIKERGEKHRWTYRKHWLPHDARAETLQTGRSILDDAIAEWGPARVDIVPRLDIQDGIQAFRKVLEHPGTRIHTRCSERADPEDTDGLECLREYRREWDEKNLCFRQKPLHDWASHTADAARYLGVVVDISEMLVRPKPEEKPSPPARSLDSFNLDELWPLARGRSGGRI